MEAYPVKEVLFYCNVSTSHNTKIEPKPIPYYDLTFVLKGSLTYLANGKTYVLQENDVLLLPPDTLRARLAGTRAVQYVSFNFLIGENTALPSLPFYRNAVSEEMRRLIALFPHRTLSPLYHAREKACNLLNYILLELTDVIALPSTNPNVIAMLQYVDGHINQPLSLSAVADHVHLSREYTAFLFKRETGKTVTDYVGERKMLLAKGMIQAGEHSLQEIAAELGFENYAYFSRLFKRHFHVTPMELKKRLSE